MEFTVSIDTFPLLLRLRVTIETGREGNMEAVTYMKLSEVLPEAVIRYYEHYLYFDLPDGTINCIHTIYQKKELTTITRKNEQILPFKQDSFILTKEEATSFVLHGIKKIGKFVSEREITEVEANESTLPLSEF